MTLYELRQSELKPITNTTFAEEQFSERGDLQRLLRDQPEVLEQGLFVVAEEFGNWADSRRRHRPPLCRHRIAARCGRAETD